MSDPTKLPKWAQQRIERAERNADYWRAKAEVGPAESDTFLHSYTDDGRNGGTPLGTGVDVRFDVSEGTYFLARIERGALQIQVGSRSGDGLVVRPQSSNTVRIEALR